MIKDDNLCGAANALVRAIAGLQTAVVHASESLAEYRPDDEPDYGEGMKASAIPTLQRRAKAHRRKRNKRAR